MKKLMLAAAAVIGLTTALPAAAQFAKPEDAIKYRQSGMQLMGQHFGRIGAMVNGRIPFGAKVLADNAAIVEYMSKLPYAGFVDGSDKGAPTKAKPEIWIERDKFNAAATKLQDDVVKLNVAAKTGNFDQIKAAFGTAGQSCKACHDNYREK